MTTRELFEQSCKADCFDPKTAQNHSIEFTVDEDGQEASIDLGPVNQVSDRTLELACILLQEERGIIFPNGFRADFPAFAILAEGEWVGGN